MCSIDEIDTDSGDPIAEIDDVLHAMVGDLVDRAALWDDEQILGALKTLINAGQTDTFAHYLLSTEYAWRHPEAFDGPPSPPPSLDDLRALGVVATL